MKLTSIELTNFKAIGETVVFPVKPITLIFGANSAGKSSILQCLAMLAQSVTNERWFFNPEDHSDPCLVGKGSFVDVGNYQNFTHKHDSRKSFECKFNFDMDVDILFNPNIDRDGSYSVEDPTERLKKLNDSAKKLKNTLTSFKKTALSFSFNNGELENMVLFLEGKPVFSYSNSRMKMHPGHIYWAAYWSMFKTEIYNKFYDHFKRVYDYLKNSEEGNFLKKYGVIPPEEETIAIHLGMAPNLKSIIELYSLVCPDAFFVQLQEKALQGINELEIVVELYYFLATGPGYSNFMDIHITNFLGFLPSKFANCTPVEFLGKTSSSFHTDNIELFLPIPLMVLVAFHINLFLDSFSYIGPLRQKPERFYVAEDISPKLTKGDCDNLFQLLAKDEKLIHRVNIGLKHLQTGYQIKLLELTDQTGEGYGVYILQFIDQKTGIAASIKDVGFGFSQILPVIVKTLTSFNGTVLIEQPELHLHPALQAELGDMFIRGALGTGVIDQAEIDREYFHADIDGMEPPSQFFIETHSEHLILRLLRRIRETSEGELPENVPPITPEDIAVLYVQPGTNGAQVTHIPVTADGEFAIPWPGGFFAERAKELF